LVPIIFNFKYADKRRNTGHRNFNLKQVTNPENSRAMNIEILQKYQATFKWRNLCTSKNRDSPYEIINIHRTKTEPAGYRMRKRYTKPIFDY